MVRIIFEKRKKQKAIGLETKPMIYYPEDDLIQPMLFYSDKAGPESIKTALELLRKNAETIFPMKFYPMQWYKPYKQALAEMQANETERLKQLAIDLERSGEDDFRSRY